MNELEPMEFRTNKFINHKDYKKWIKDNECKVYLEKNKNNSAILTIEILVYGEKCGEMLIINTKEKLSDDSYITSVRATIYWYPWFSSMTYLIDDGDKIVFDIFSNLKECLGGKKWYEPNN